MKLRSGRITRRGRRRSARLLKKFDSINVYLEPPPRLVNRPPSFSSRPWVSMQQEMSLLPVTINGIECTMLVDTGTSHTFIQHRLAQTLGLLERISGYLNIVLNLW
ncbi:hypothetical protein OTU49_016505 [Cherax quadricarinatus]|uniref:Gag-pol polyprotein n=1 Tax=Cherax quadricarinatus TaxID=27406 RepID=A0AAW0XSU4_CHEQU